MNSTQISLICAAGFKEMEPTTQTPQCHSIPSRQYSVRLYVQMAIAADSLVLSWRRVGNTTSETASGTHAQNLLGVKI